MAAITSRKTRKLVHLTIGLILYLLSFVLEKDILLWLIVIGGIFAFATFRLPWFRSLHHSHEGSLGTLYYPAGIFAAFLILYPHDMVFFRIALLVLTISDTLANLAGHQNHRNTRFRIFDRKSLYGLIVYALSSLIIFLAFLPGDYSGDIALLLFLTLLTVASEAISYRGSDNLTIPLVLALFFSYIQAGSPEYYYYHSLVLAGFSAGAILLFRLHILSRRASLAAWLLGLHLSLVMGWIWLLPVMLFFVSSVTLTKVHTATHNHKSSSGIRNLWQVMANSLWALASTIAYLLTQQELFVYLFIVFMAAVTADTWASEAGPLINKKVLSLADMRMRKAGVSGGVSLGGSLAALAGAVFIAVPSCYVFFGHWNLLVISLIIMAALAGTFADSLLGAFAEGSLEKLSFFRQPRHSEAISPNDIVNLGGSLLAGLVWLML